MESFVPLNCNPPAITRGYLSLSSPSITALSESTSIDPPRNPHPAHITLLSKDEYRTYTGNPKKTPFEDIDISKVYPVGVSERKDVWFIPVLWNAGNVWRIKNGFGVKDFHITLSKKDLHDIDKSLYTITDSKATHTEINGTFIPPDLDTETLDQLYLFSHLRNDDIPRQVSWAEHIIHSHPSSERGYLRLADLAYKQSWPKLAMLSYCTAFTLSNGEGVQKRQSYYTRKLASCLESTEFGPLLTEDERTHLISTISPSTLTTLTQPWSPHLPLNLPEVHLSRTTESRIRYHTLHPAYKLPRFFSWLIPRYLAAMSTPRRADDISLLSTLGITHVLTLTSETPLPEPWFSGTPRNTFIPVENYHPPTTQQMDRSLHLILSEPFSDPSTPGATLVHCGGGKGRAGTVLACYLALFGFTPPHAADYNTGPPKMGAKAAVELLRRIRPGSVETERQERFVDAYVSLAWKRFGSGCALIGDGGEVQEPSGEVLEVKGNVDGADMVVLVGVQGSGKSAFARMCRVRNPDVVVVSPDAVTQKEGVGSAEARRACEGVVEKFRKVPGRKVLILDRCNPTRQERKEWRELFACGGKVVAVWFDYDTELCRARAENRSGHETLPPHRVKGAIASMAKLLEPPTVEEGFSGVVRVRGIDNVRELANSWFGEPGIKKFIRTRHLLDLGSATRDDLVIERGDLQTRFNTPVIVEEKVDGANLGFSLSSDIPPKIRVQNRSHYISSSDQAQFGKLDLWLSGRTEQLEKLLGRDPVVPERYVLYGEWLAATHSIAYDKLSDYFLAFDLYDRLSDKFATRDELRGLLTGTDIKVVPEIYRGVLESEEMLLGFLERESMFASGTRVEGVVVRWEGRGERGKVVRSDFIVGSRHWSKNSYRKNELARDVDGE